MRRLPPLAQLRAFEAAARLLSFRRGAEELGVTPTAISHQIRLLEQFSGQALFHRHPRPLRLSEAGARLYPEVRQGLDQFAAGIAAITPSRESLRLRVTTTNAFASRWLVPRLAAWKAARPDIALEIIGTDAVLDLPGGEADVAIRYMHGPPADLTSTELFRDRFAAVCSPRLLSNRRQVSSLEDLERHTAINCYWSPTDPHAPTWARWLEWSHMSRDGGADLRRIDQLSFREELHAIEAAVAGQGILVVSDLLVASELASGALVRAMEFTAPGFGFYVAHIPGAPKVRLIEAFAAWAASVTGA